MIKVILIDDEEIITKGLVDFVDWNELNMKVVGVANDGRKGLALIESMKPEVVITDIKMPHLDGLDFMAAAKKIIPGGIFVIVSGHDNFHYAQKAIRLGAFDYVLKPIDLDLFQNLLRDISNRLKNTVPEGNSVKEFYTNLIYNENNLDEISMRAKMLGLNEYRWHQVVLFDIDVSDIEIANLNIILEKMKSEFVRDTASIFKQISNNQFISVCSAARKIDIEDCVSIMLKSVRQYFNNMNYRETAGVGLLVQELGDLQRSYNTAGNSLRNRYILGRDIDIYYDPQNNSETHLYKIDDHQKYIDTIITHIKYLRRNNLKENIAILKEKIGNSFEPQQNVNIFVTEILSGAVKLLEESKIPIQSLDVNPMHINIELLKSETIDEAFEGLLSILDQIMRFLNENKSEKKHIFEMRVRDLVEANYMRPEFSLSEAAEHTSFSPNYFTMLFKDCFSKTFVEYLTDIRLDKAKELLLLSDLKISKISLRTGYDNPSYFSSVFKKKTGFTPNDFRNYAFNGHHETIPENIDIKSEDS